jgi:anti-sigma regulatory factor (Ser/Thr protein kinase)
MNDAVVVSFMAQSTSVAAARRHTVAQFERWGVGGQSTAAALVVSELATNAIRHARSGFELGLTRGEHSVRITVDDPSDDSPTPRQPLPGAGSGYGLMIVERLATEWGWDFHDHGKSVWADLEVPTSGPPGAV